MSLFAQSGIKIGYVDSQIILSQYPEAIKAQSDIDAVIAEANRKIDSMTAELQAAYTDAQKQFATMTEEKQREVQQQLVTKEQEIQQFRQKKFGQSGEIYVKQDQLLAPVKQKILVAINTVSKEESLNFVFDKAGDVILLYADEEYDVTFKVLDKLKRGK